MTNQVAKNALPASLATKQVKPIAKTIAVLVRILTPTKLRV